jgi:acetyl esterase/lipase
MGRSAQAVVVLVPGGGWIDSDPKGLALLAQSLADAGALAVRITYRTATDEAFFPDPVRDVGCGLAFAADLAAKGAGRGLELVVLGHSAGAQLAAVAALDPELAAAPDCPYAPAAVDRLVGLAGPYDVVAFADQAVNLFGPQNADPAQWDPGNPVVLAARRPELPVLLVHGSADPLVPPSSSAEFAAALEAAGHPVTTITVDGADHQSIYGADVTGPLVVEWLGLAPRDNG